jgi:hypothetical protein
MVHIPKYCDLSVGIFRLSCMIPEIVLPLIYFEQRVTKVY